MLFYLDYSKYCKSALLAVHVWLKGQRLGAEELLREMAAGRVEVTKDMLADASGSSPRLPSPEDGAPHVLRSSKMLRSSGIASSGTFGMISSASHRFG